MPAPVALAFCAVASVALGAGAALFVFALLAMPASQKAPLFALGLPLVVAGFGVLPFSRGETLRPRLRTLGFLTAFAALGLALTAVWWMGETGAAIAIGIAGCGWLTLMERYDARAELEGFARTSALIGVGGFAFLWGHLELDRAISPSVSSLLLIGYYATASVGFVAWGRARRSPQLRRVGLGLGLIAAFLAARGAWQIPAAGARIAAYLLVSVFLLGIAWWYRQPDEAEAPVA